MKFIGFYDYTVILTYLSLISSLIGMEFAADGQLAVAICCLVISGICDMFDGVIARSKKDRTADGKNFGIQIDSLCDLVCFGVFPAIILHFCGVDGVLGHAILILYVLCAVIRLAFFNVLETKRQTTEDGCAKGYRGLPVTSIAIILPFFRLVGLLLPDTANTVICYIIPALVGILFIADFHFPKPDIGGMLQRGFSKKSR